MTKATLTIRPIEAEDRPDWARLWRDYLAFYKTELSPELYDSAFAQLMSDTVGDFHGLMAFDGARPVGLTHYVYHRHMWRVEPVCYLQDLYVAPEARGTGAGRALIEAVYAAADADGAPAVYWLTQDFNEVARRLYDRIADVTPFIKYARRVA